MIEKEKEIIQFFQTGISPVFEEETLEISAFMQENGFCDVYDLFQSDPDILRITGSEVSFTEEDIDENTAFII